MTDRQRLLICTSRALLNKYPRVRKVISLLGSYNASAKETEWNLHVPASKIFSNPLSKAIYSVRRCNASIQVIKNPAEIKLARTMHSAQFDSQMNGKNSWEFDTLNSAPRIRFIPIITKEVFEPVHS